MIIYQTNKNWLADITHLARSWTMVKIMRSVIGMGIFTTVLCIIDLYVYEFLQMSSAGSVFSLLGIVLSILLVFRTNTAYDRWWEGRQLWGTLVNESRNLAIMANTTFPESEHEAKKRLATLISNFAIGLKEHLRKGVNIEEMIMLSETDKKEYPSKNHLPAYITNQMHFLVQHQYKEKNITGEDLLNMKPHLQAFMEIAGACERIKKTPIPFSYSIYIKIFISVYSILLPLALIPEYGLMSIPVVMLVFFAFIGVQLMAEEIEDPFGLDCNDLPIGDIAHTIKNNAFEILDSRTVKDIERAEYEKVF